MSRRFSFSKKRNLKKTKVRFKTIREINEEFEVSLEMGIWKGRPFIALVKNEVRTEEDDERQEIGSIFFQLSEFNVIAAEKTLKMLLAGKLSTTKFSLVHAGGEGFNEKELIFAYKKGKKNFIKMIERDENGKELFSIKIDLNNIIGDTSVIIKGEEKIIETAPLTLVLLFLSNVIPATFDVEMHGLGPSAYTNKKDEDDDDDDDMLPF